MAEIREHYVANESEACWMDEGDALEDRKLFVRNLGELLSETREGIVGAELDDNEIVTVTYNNGYQLRVNVNMDSYTAIIRDVTKAI